MAWGRWMEVPRRTVSTRLPVKLLVSPVVQIGLSTGHTMPRSLQGHMLLCPPRNLNHITRVGCYGAETAGGRIRSRDIEILADGKIRALGVGREDCADTLGWEGPVVWHCDSGCCWLEGETAGKCKYTRGKGPRDSCFESGKWKCRIGRWHKYISKGTLIPTYTRCLDLKPMAFPPFNTAPALHPCVYGKCYSSGSQ